MGLPLAVIALRFVQYAGAAVLFGSPLFFLYARLEQGNEVTPGLSCGRQLLTLAALALAVTAPLNFLAQTAQVAGSVSAITDPDILKAAFLEMDFGKSCVVRTALALLALFAVYYFHPGKRLWRVIAAFGAMICASFSWMGHGAVTEGILGWVHLSNDIIHTLAAAGWIGALVVFSLLFIRHHTQPQMFVAVLKSFSAVGVTFVCLIVATGIVNSYFLIGLDGLPLVWQSLYGQVLLAKILFFLAMLFLAARNRFSHTPALEKALVHSTESAFAIAVLRRSIVWETCLSALVLALVAWLGTLQPPSSVVADAVRNLSS